MITQGLEGFPKTGIAYRTKWSLRYSLQSYSWSSTVQWLRRWIVLSTFRALKPSESDSKAQFLKCLSHLRKALASCDHDCYVIRNRALACIRLPPARYSELWLARGWFNIQSMHSGENYLSSILSDARAPQRRVVVLFRYSTQKTEVSLELHTIPLLSID